MSILYNFWHHLHEERMIFKSSHNRRKSLQGKWSTKTYFWDRNETPCRGKMPRSRWPATWRTFPRWPASGILSRTSSWWTPGTSWNRWTSTTSTCFPAPPARYPTKSFSRSTRTADPKNCCLLNLRMSLKKIIRTENLTAFN